MTPCSRNERGITTSLKSNKNHQWWHATVALKDYLVSLLSLFVDAREGSQKKHAGNTFMDIESEFSPHFKESDRKLLLNYKKDTNIYFM